MSLNKTYWNKIHIGQVNYFEQRGFDVQVRAAVSVNVMYFNHRESTNIYNTPKGFVLQFNNYSNNVNFLAFVLWLMPPGIILDKRGLTLPHSCDGRNLHFKLQHPQGGNSILSL
jgi:hypothetical protein